MNQLMLFLCLSLYSISLIAQNTPVAVGHWQTHLNYINAIGVEESSQYIFIATDAAVIIREKTTEEVNYLTTVNGLSDVDIETIHFDEVSQLLLVAYSNGNLDVITSDLEVINKSDIKRNTAISGLKSIQKIHVADNIAYFVCSFGLVEFNLETYNFGETILREGINDMTTHDETLFVATDDGIFSIRYNELNINDFSNWTKHGTVMNLPLNLYISSTIEVFNNAIYASVNDTVFQFQNNQWNHISTTNINNNTSSPYYILPDFDMSFELTYDKVILLFSTVLMV